MVVVEGEGGAFYELNSPVLKRFSIPASPPPPFPLHS